MAIGIYQRKHEGSKVFYASAKEYTFCCKKLIDGKKVAVLNSVTGNPKTSVDGTPEFHEHVVSFDKYADRFTEDGYWSVFEVKPDTPVEIVEKLDQLAADRGTPDVMTEEKFLERFHPNVMIEKKESKKLKDKLAKAEAEISQLKNAKRN